MHENGYITCSGGDAGTAINGDSDIRECNRQTFLTEISPPGETPWFFADHGKVYCPAHWPPYITFDNYQKRDARRSDETFNEFYRNLLNRVG